MKPLLFATPLAVLFLAGCSKQPDSVAKAAESKAPAAIVVSVARAEARSVERAVAVTGSLHPDETTTVSSEVPGRVTKLAADFGQSVSKGQVIAELDTLELSLQLERSRAALAQAQARIGLDPKKDDDSPDSTPAMRQAWNVMEDARAKFESGRKLVKSGDIAQERFNELEKNFLARQAAFEATRDDLRTQLAVIRSLRAEVKLAEKRVRDATVVAPFDGSIAQKHVAPGQYIKENVAIYTLVKTNPLRLRVDIPEAAVADVRLGSTLSFSTDAAPGREFHAVVRELNPALDARSRTLVVEARLLESSPQLRPGTFVQVRLVTSKATPVVSVPRAAVYTVAGLNKLFTIENGKAVEHRIDEILGANGSVEIPANIIPAGAQVAISNLSALYGGAPVSIDGGRS